MRGKLDCVDHGYKGNAKGYSQTLVDGRLEYRHRAAYATHLGILVRYLRGVVMHTCDNPRCIRLAHLKLGTHQDNMDDMMRKGRHYAPSGEASPHAVLTEELVKEIKMRYRPRCKVNGARALGREFRVSEVTVRDALHGRTWGYVS